MREPTHVEARFAEDGSVTLIRFMWRSRWRRVASVGRQWRDGEAQYFLAMSPDNEVFELVLEAGRWSISPTALPPAAV